MTASLRFRARCAAHYLALLAALLLALALLQPGRPNAQAALPVEGSLIAAFVTQDEIILMSDGRAVSSADGSIVREDLPKVHRLAIRAGMLTAGRSLPDLPGLARARAAAQASAGLVAEVAAVRQALQDEWIDVMSAANGAPTGRTFAFVAGFDERGVPRVFYLDTRTAPDIRVNEMSILDDGRDLEVVAISSSIDGSADASSLIVRHIEAVYRARPSIGRRDMLVQAFVAAQAEMSASDPRIGGRTFAATIDRANGYSALEVDFVVGPAEAARRPRRSVNFCAGNSRF